MVRYFVEEREKRDRLRGGKADTEREGEKESSFFSFINEEMVSNFCVGCISKKFSRPQTEWAEGLKKHLKGRLNFLIPENADITKRRLAAYK